MVRFLELMRLLAIFALAAFTLASCSSNGTDSVISAVVDNIGSGNEAEAVQDPAESITRAQIDSLGVALIRVRERSTGEQKLLVAFRKSGPQITYVLRSERRLVLHGGLIQSTFGFGDNLAPLGVSDHDPIAFPRPIAEWPQTIVRDYDLSNRGVGMLTRVECKFIPGPIGVLDIVGRELVVQTVGEECAGGGIEFANRYDVDPKNGYIWQSEQWTGATQGALIYEVLEPLEE